MAIGSKLKQIIEDKDIKPAELAAKANLSAQTIYSLISRDSNKVSIDALMSICNVLNISVEELYQYDLNDKQINSGENLDTINISVTNHEKKVITAYRNKPEMQGAVDKLLEVEEEKQNNTIDISAYTENIAAGTGEKGFTPEKLKEVDKFARQVAELENGKSD